MKTYMRNGIHIVEFEPDKLALTWWDAPKKQIPAPSAETANSFNAGFFGCFKSGKLKYTLPVANLKCDSGQIGAQQALDIRSWGGTVGGSVTLSGASPQPFVYTPTSTS